MSEEGFLHEYLENTVSRLRLSMLSRRNILESLKRHLKLIESYLNNVETWARVLVLVLAPPPPPQSSRSKYILTYLSPPCVFLCAHTIVVTKKQQQRSASLMQYRHKKCRPYYSFLAKSVPSVGIVVVTGPDPPSQYLNSIRAQQSQRHQRSFNLS